MQLHPIDETFAMAQGGRMLRALVVFVFAGVACAPRAAEEASPSPDGGVVEGGAAARVPSASRPEPRAPSAGCFVRGRASCDPVTNAGCVPAEACDLVEAEADLVLGCEVPAVDKAARTLGESCSLAAGARCGAGLRCASGSCRTYCCGDGDCRVVGERCLALDVRLGTLGTCGPPPVCKRSGETCRVGADCCSAECHFDHCH